MPGQLHCGENTLTSFVQGGAEDDTLTSALRKAFQKMTKALVEGEKELTDTGPCPDECIKKTPAAPDLKGTWTCKYLTVKTTRQGKCGVSYRFVGTLKVTCTPPKNR